MEAHRHNPIILPVANLQASSSFYLTVLQPLGYQNIKNTKDHTSQPDSEAYGLGPVNTNRVDVLLLPAETTQNSRNGGRASHLIFPAASRVVVREFYAAGLNSGARVVSRPANIDNGAEFSAIIADFDGNEIEVGFTDPAVRASPFPKGSETTVAPTSTFIEQWRDSVVENQHPRDVRSSLSAVGSLQSGPLHKESPTRLRRASNSSSKKEDGNLKDSGSPTGGKKFVGTLLGAAAGAAVVYALAQELEDSKAKEQKFNDRMDSRRRLKAEAKASAIASQWREKAQNSRRRSSLTDRDSGYYSRREPSPDTVRYRTVTYEPRPDNRRDTQSRSSSSRTATRAIEPAPAPKGSQSSKSGVNRGSSLRSRPVTHVTVDTPPSRPPRPSPPSGQENSSLGLGRSATVKSRPTPRSGTSPRNDEPSVKPTSREVPRPSGSVTRTIRYVPVTTSPPERSKSIRRSQDDGPRRSTTREAMPPPPPPQPPQQPDLPHTRSPDQYIDQLDLDDETVVPDDSISCVSSDAGPQHRAKKSSRGGSGMKSRNGMRRKLGVAY